MHGGLSPHPLDDLMQGCRIDVDHVHADLCATGAGEAEPDGLHAAHPPTRLSDGSRDGLSDPNVVRRQVEVVGDERVPSANQHGSRPGIDLARPFVRDELSCVDASPELVETSTPEVRGAAPLSDLAVEKDGEPQLLSDSGGHQCEPRISRAPSTRERKARAGTTSTAPTRG